MITPLLLICVVVGINSFNVTTAEVTKANYRNKLREWVDHLDDVEWTVQEVVRLIDSQNLDFFDDLSNRIGVLCRPTVCEKLAEVFGNAGYQIKKTAHVIVMWNILPVTKFIGISQGIYDIGYFTVSLFSKVYDVAHLLAATIRKKKKENSMGSVDWKGSVEECNEIGDIFKGLGYGVIIDKVIVISW